MEEMLERESLSDHPMSAHLLFVCGRSPYDDKLVRVEPENDSIEVSVDDMEIMSDIDSLEWQGTRLRLQGPLAMHTGPWVGRKAPISKNNSCYVELLVPQSDADKDMGGGRSEWFQRSTAHSTIPHTHFGIISSSAPNTVMNIYLFFPRMQHRHEYTGRWDTYIPWPIQCVLWNEIILPSINATASTAVELTYMSMSVDYGLYKSRTATHKSGDASKMKTQILSAEKFLAVQNYMQEFIDENPERYGIFGSYFLVLEAKGIKHLTQTPLGVSPWERLEEAFPSIDFDWLLDRKNGELVADFGITYTPKNKGPLVGLWRLPSLVASYESSGFLAGTTHMTSMMGGYGSMSSEMGLSRSQQVHMKKRLSYNLEYETIRTVTNTPVVIKDSDAYHFTEEYTTYCKKRISQYQAAQKKTFGLRDEYRMGGMAIQELNLEPQALYAKVSLST
jgi:hypothetical protein